MEPPGNHSHFIIIKYLVYLVTVNNRVTNL